ncbi:MAG: S4 domain-containing protein YaaA [Bacilli bacterium]|nr:S4 domain-containing protein YaaA [Bacilli bacterium]
MNIKNQTITLKTPYITLGQLLKLTRVVGSGGEVKAFLASNSVKINGTVDIRRGRKLYKGDVIDFGSEKIMLN